MRRTVERPWLVISWYTDKYADLNARLDECCQKWGLEHIRIHREPRDSWANTTRHMAGAILEAMESTTKNVLYIDSDATIESYPTLIDRIDAMGYDVGVHHYDQGVLGGTLYLRNSEAVRAFVKRWDVEIQKGAGLDQVCLNYMLPDSGLRVYDFGPRYCWIFDTFRRHYPDMENPVIVHWQASRSRRW